MLQHHRYDATIQKVFTIVADGARCMVKSLDYLKAGLPNVGLLLKDPCHTLRIACGNPLTLESTFSKWWSEVP